MRLRLAVLLALALAGCRMSVVVTVHVHEDGSGDVEAAVGLDDAALARVGDPATELRVEDLKAAGWEVVGPRREDDGRTWTRVRHSFRRPEEASALFTVLGPPFRDLTVGQTRSFARVETALKGTVDLTAGIESFGDDLLRDRLGGHALGVDAAELERQLGLPLAEAFDLSVVARLPGAVDANAASKGESRAVWTPALGERLELRAEAEAWQTDRIAFASGAVLAAVALLVVLLRRAWVRRRTAP